MTLIERLLAQANKEANELADLLNEAAEALAQPQQEPKFFYDEEDGLLHDSCCDAPTGCIPLYTSPPARKPLRWHTLPDTLPPKRKDSNLWSQRVWLALPDGRVVAGDCLFAYPDATHSHAVHTWFGDRCQLDADPIAWMPFAVPDHPRAQTQKGTVGPSGDRLSDFRVDQWWFLELDKAVQNGTAEQKQAVAVVRNLLATIQTHLQEPPTE